MMTTVTILIPWPSELVARARALGWSQNELARRAGKDTGFVSRLLAGKLKSPGVYRTLVKTVERAERRRAKTRVRTPLNTEDPR